ncbi:uncharacterized protein LOC133741913 isoform X1 [Rosa rugosa]|uniref:uncharacterized protein LOC133741913 isoform X1 n=1 Tax=Rosa rugosa TaxID=74645 RepID=UPI002B407D3C|nr:uncharacterized protein LOC133741913 isoform X1 [Rosa rugosa]
MVATSSPDWLPAGWSVQFRAQNRGRRTAIYTDLETGKKFFSKDDVIRYTKKATNRGEEPQRTNTKNPSDRSHSQLAANTDEYPEWLPDGWKVELRTRKTGIQVGREYKCYIDPLTECTFYSKPEVFRYLKTVKRKSCKSRSHKMVNRKRCIIKTKTITAVQLPSKVVVEKHNVEDLPPGWILEVKVRKVANRIRRDPYYTDPVHGYVFRSKKEVIRYLQTGETSKHTIKPKSMGTNDLKLTDDEIALSSATKKQKLKHPVTRRQLSEAKKSYEPSGLDLQETENSKLQDKRPTESICALAPVTEVILEKHFTENLVEECVETKGDCSPRWSSQPKAEPSSKHEGKRSSQPQAVLSNKREAKRSKLQDKRVTDDSKVALAPTAEAVPHEHLSESVVENCAKTKEYCSPSKSLQPKAELSNKCEDPGKVVFSEDDPALTPAANTLNKNSHMSRMERRNTRRSQIDARKSKQKEKLNLPRRSSKRLAGLEPEPVNSLVSTVQALQVTTRKSSKGDGSRDAGLALDGFVNRASQQLGDASETEVAHHTITGIISTVQGEPLSKIKRPFDGLEVQPVDTMVSNEQTLHVATRKSSRGDASRDAGLASNDFINGASLQLGDASEPEAAHDRLTDINCTSHGESLNKGKTFLDDQVVPKEQHHRLEPEKMDAEKPGPELCFLFGSDPCLEFAFKTLTGELPIADAVDNESILKPAADTVQKENTLDIGRCSRKPRAISNKSKKAKELKLPHRTSKRLAGLEPELLAKPMSSERGLRNATAKSCRSIALPAVDSAHESSQQFEAGQENKVAHDLCTVINPSIHEESLNKIEKSLKDEPVPEEKPRELEIEKAAVENPVSQFSFPFLDTWSDPCLDFAFKTLTGEIPIEDDLFQGYFQENLVTSHNQRDSLALPDFGSPNVFQSDISPQFDAPEQSVSAQLFPMNSSLPPAGNVSLSNCNGVGFGQQLSTNSSFLPAGNLRFSSGSGVGSGQHLSVNSSFLPAGNVGQPNWSGIGTQNPCLASKKDFHGKVKS